MNIFKWIKDEIYKSVEGIVPDTHKRHDWFDAVVTEPPKDPTHGDVATNAAMVLSRATGMIPKELAAHIGEHLTSLEGVESYEIAGPGFLNLRLSASLLQRQVAEIIEQGITYGDSALGGGAKVNVEYVSANPTGPMHIGHARGAVVGDALANLMQKAGYAVTKEYYINDAGAQIDALTWSAYYRYWEACGKQVDFAKAAYPGEYLITVGEGLKAAHGEALLTMDETKWFPIVREFTMHAMMEMIKGDLADLGIRHDVFTSEKTLHEAQKIAAALETLKEKRLIYRGVLEPPKGKTPDDWEPREQTLFQTTKFGDDSDRALQKSDGSWTYFAADVAYAKDKYDRGFETQLLVLGADHGGYVRRMEAAVRAISDSHASVNILLCQLVKFMEGGEPIKMSKRAGTFTTVRDVIDAVGKDVIRFIMLTRKPEQPLDFDLAKVTEQSRDNPVFYVQYAHARCHSLLRIAGEEVPEAVEPSASPESKHLDMLNSEAELALISQLVTWPRVVEAAAQAYEPHRIAYYLQELAAGFHALWNSGNDDITLRFIQKDAIDMTIARLALARATATALASGLMVLGVQPLKEM